MFILGVARIALSLVWGTALTDRFEDLGAAERIAVGIAFGFALDQWAAPIFGLAVGIRAAAALALALTVVLTALELLRVQRRGSSSPLHRELARTKGARGRALLLVTVVVAGFAAYLTYAHTLHPVKKEGSIDDGWLCASGYSYSDQSMHATFANSFLESGNKVPPDYPLCAGWKMPYPFLPDYEAASLSALRSEPDPTVRATLEGFGSWSLREGLTLWQSFWLTAWISSIGLFLVVVSLARSWAGDGARFAVIVAPMLFFFSGGLGFLEVLNTAFYWKPAETTGAPTLWQVLSPAIWHHDLTNLPEQAQISYTNITTSILMPARNALFGMLMGGAALILLTKAIDKDLSKKEELIGAGVLVGLLPLVHTHSFLALWFAACLYAARDMVQLVVFRLIDWMAPPDPETVIPPFWPWLWALVPLALVSLPQVLWIKLGLSGTEPFFHANRGWESNAPWFYDWVWFWIKNAGLFFVLVPVAWLTGSFRQRRLAAPFLLLFCLANVVHLQPWSHDNVKLFAYAQLAGAMLVASFLARLWKSDAAGKVLAIQAVIICTITGALMVVRDLDLEQGVMDIEAREFAEIVKRETPKNAIILTGEAHNHPVPVLTGRTVVCGYHGWLFTHGVPWDEADRDATKIYHGDPELRELLEKWKVDYIVIGPNERYQFQWVNDTVLRQQSTWSDSWGRYMILRMR